MFYRPLSELKQYGEGEIEKDRKKDREAECVRVVVLHLRFLSRCNETQYHDISSDEDASRSLHPLLGILTGDTQRQKFSQAIPDLEYGFESTRLSQWSLKAKRLAHFDAPS